MKILLAGCGKIGLALAEQLKFQHQFVGLKRSPANLDFPIFTADLSELKSLRNLPTDFDIILYTATPDSRNEASYRSNVYQGVANLLTYFTSSTTALPYFIFISSTAVYGQDNGEWVDENSPTEPPRFNGQVLVDSEQLLQNTQINSLILRLSGIYSDERLALFNRAIKGVEASQDYPAWSNRIHFVDVTGCLVFLLDKIGKGEALAPVYNVTDSEPASYWDVYSYIAKACGTPPPTNSNNDQVSGKKVSNQRLIKLGYQFTYPDYKAGYQAAIDNYLKHLS